MQLKDRKKKMNLKPQKEVCACDKYTWAASFPNERQDGEENPKFTKKDAR